MCNLTVVFSTLLSLSLVDALLAIPGRLNGSGMPDSEVSSLIWKIKKMGLSPGAEIVYTSSTFW